MKTPNTIAMSKRISLCEGHPAGESDPMGQTVFCDGSCLQSSDSDGRAEANEIAQGERNYRQQVLGDDATTVTTEPAKAWVVTAPSSYRLGHTCFLGRGATKTEALENAVGPKPWGNAAKRIARNADVYQVTADEADEMEHRGDA